MTDPSAADRLAAVFREEHGRVLGALVRRYGDVTLAERRPIPPMGHFSLVRFAKKAG